VTNLSEDRLTACVASYPYPRMALLPALRLVGQDGVPTGETLTEVARLCQTDVAAAQELLNAYPNLCGGPPKALLCTGLVCRLRGARRIAESPEAAGLEAGQLETTSCLGYCFAAPVFKDAGGCVHHLEPPAAPAVGLPGERG